MLEETTDTPLLEARDVAKRYAHVDALKGADLDVREGEIVGLVGDNGAGKSTLLKILCGVARMDAGEILLRGRPVTLDSPAAARAHGIEAVFQDLALAGDLNPVYNFFLGREIVRGGLLGRLGFLDKRAMAAQAETVFERYGLKLAQPSAPVAGLSGGQKQSVAVIRSVAGSST
jgi:simple sugar transport system ATP-binding protein